MAITEALTRSYGPLPGWAWAGVAAAGAWLVLPRLRSASSKTAAGATATPGPDATYGLGFAQGLQAGPRPPGGTAPPGGRTGHTVPAPPGFPRSGYGAIPIYSSPTSTSPSGWAPFDSDLNITGGAVQGRAAGSGTATWYPIDWGGTQGFVNADSFAGFASAAASGVGGAAAAIGRRTDWLMSPHHPLVSAAHRYPHFVRAVGGPGNHSREVLRVAQQAGVHPARVMQLNPVSTGFIRVA